MLFLALLHTIKTGQFVGAIGDGRVAYVTRQDCAKAAVGTLLSDDLDGKMLNITDPKAYSHQDNASASTPSNSTQ